MILAWLLTWRERRQRRRRALDLLLLGLVQRLEPDAYGVPLQRELLRLGFRCGSGSLYATLWRLERTGDLRSQWGEATAVRGGRRRRLYFTTVLGRRALANIDPA